ncbi:MAG: hypothetical protein AAB439_03620 [Patescibacteria group bacterium]
MKVDLLLFGSALAVLAGDEFFTLIDALDGEKDFFHLIGENDSYYQQFSSISWPEKTGMLGFFGGAAGFGLYTARRGFRGMFRR